MEQDRTRKRGLSAALVAIAAGGTLAGTAFGSPPDRAPAHGVRGDTPPPHAAQPSAPPAHAPAHGVRGTQPSAKPDRSAAGKSRGAKGAKGAKPSRSAAGKSRGAKGAKGAKPGRSAAKSRGAKGAKPGRSGDRPSGRRPKATLCHATGSDTNPYVTITIADRAVERAHDGHQHDEDIIPAPEGGCPGPAATADAVGRAARGGVAGRASSGSASGSSELAGVITSSQVSELDRAEEQGKIRVLGEIDTEEGASGTAGASDQASAPASAPQEADDDGLPFTGADLALIAALGVALLLTGIAVRRAAANRAA